MCYKLIKIVQSRGVHNIPFKMRSIIHNKFAFENYSKFLSFRSILVKLLKLEILPSKVTIYNKIFRCHSYVLSCVATWIK